MREAPTSRDYVAVLDIGSNAVRFVVYDGLNRAPVKIHNERDICSLGADLATTGRLRPEGQAQALESIGRFSGLIRAMGIRRVYAVATAALRDAQDGPDFIARVERDFGLRIRVVDGEEEARLSAVGVMMNGLGSHGVIGDYGGGSLELIVVGQNRVRYKASLPLGSHRLHAIEGRAARLAYIDRHLAEAPFLAQFHGQDFYALGGSWRSMAKAHIRMTRHPLQALDHYTIDGGKARDFADMLSRQSLASLEKTAGLSQNRVRDMGVAALTMARLFEKISPARLVFSGTGLREGLLYDALAPAQQRQDALLASCRKIAAKISRFDHLRAFSGLARWMAPLFSGEDHAFFRLLESACLLSDTGWFEHEDDKADNAFSRILLLPFYGVDHRGRAFMALANYVRYGGADLADGPAAQTAQALLSETERAAAITAGLAMRVAIC